MASLHKLLSEHDKKADAAGAWAAIAAVLSVVRAAAAEMRPGSGAYVVKRTQSRNVAIVAAEAAAELLSADDAATRCAVGVAPFSHAACKAEYLEQANWPVRDRIPFTFPPESSSSGGGAAPSAEVTTHRALAVPAGPTADLVQPFTLHRAAANAAKRSR